MGEDRLTNERIKHWRDRWREWENAEAVAICMEVLGLRKENEEMSKEITNLKIRILGKVPTIGKRQEFFCHICDADVLGDYGFYERERWYPLCMECARRLEGCVLGEKHVIWKGAVHARPTD